MLKSFKQIISLLILAGFYLLTNIDFQDWHNTSLLQKTSHLLKLVPFTTGATFLAAAFFNRQSGEKMAWDKIFRLYCTIGILLGLFFGLYYYATTPPAG